MKKILLAATALAAFVFAGAAHAAPTVAYNIGVTNDYVFRGLTQNSGDAALQGGVDLTDGMFYAGTWLSNVSFADHEMDIYAGITPTWGKANFNLGVITYQYNSKFFNTTEVKAAVSYPVGKATLGLAFYDDVDYASTSYVEFNGAYPLTDKLSLSGAIGQQSFTTAKYSTANIGLTYAITPAYSIDFRYSGVNPKIDKSRFAVLLKAAF